VLALNETKNKTRKLEALRKLGVRVVRVRKAREGGVDLKDALKKIVGLGVNSLLVEGGAKIFTAFVAKELFDEIRIFAAPMFLGGGKSAIGNVGARSLREAKRLEVVEVERSGADVFIQLRKTDGG
jgi:riboflavin biosynthesis pyrimidine reductase